MRRFLVLAVAVLVLTGCEAPPVYGPSPTPSVKPFFADEEEVLTTFEGFMAEYAAALTAFVASGGNDEASLSELVGPEQLADEREFLAGVKAQGFTFGGFYDYYRAEIQQFNQDSSTSAFVQAYVCMDYRNTFFTRPDGSTYEGSVDWTPFEAIMTANAQRELTLDELRTWTGRDFCEL